MSVLCIASSHFGCAMIILALLVPAKNYPVQDVQQAPSLPDLIVGLRSTDLQAPGQKLAITVNVKNSGAGPAPASDCSVFVRNAHAPRQTLRTYKKKVRALDPGDQFAFSFSVKLGLGLFEVTATADRKKKITEADENNNEAKILIAGR